MVSRQLRSRSKKRKSIRTPAGASVIHYGKKKPNKHSCGRCGKELHGTPNAIPSKIRKMRKTQRVPERPYAGVLCGKCMEDLMRYKTKFEIRFNYPGLSDMDFNRDLTIEKFLPRGWWQEVSSGKKKKVKKEKPKEVKKEKPKAEKKEKPKAEKKEKPKAEKKEKPKEEKKEKPKPEEKVKNKKAEPKKEEEKVEEETDAEEKPKKKSAKKEKAEEGVS